MSSEQAGEHAAVEGAPAAPPAGRRADWFTVFLMIACAALAVLVVVLARENRSLKRELAHLPALHPPTPRADELKIGDSIGAVTLIDASGARTELTFDAPSRRTLVLVYSQGCHICDEMKPIWARHVPARPPAGLRVLAVCTDRPQDFDPAKAEGIPCDRFALANAPATAFVRLRMIPATLLLDDHGVVQGLWWGYDPQSSEPELAEGLRAAGIGAQE